MNTAMKEAMSEVIGKCSFCNEVEGRKPEQINVTGNDSIRINLEKNWLELDWDGGHGIINFCPVCGRNLNEDTEETPVNDLIIANGENSNPFIRKVKIISKKNSDHLRDGYLAIIPDIKVSSMLPDFDFDGLMTCFDSLDKRDKFDALAYSCLYYRDLLTKAK